MRSLLLGFVTTHTHTHTETVTGATPHISQPQSNNVTQKAMWKCALGFLNASEGESGNMNLYAKVKDTHKSMIRIRIQVCIRSRLI